VSVGFTVVLLVVSPRAKPTLPRPEIKVIPEAKHLSKDHLWSVCTPSSTRSFRFGNVSDPEHLVGAKQGVGGRIGKSLTGHQIMPVVRQNQIELRQR